MKLDRTEARILGALVEKRWTTPDQYPLSLNALVAACNQRSNRDPVLALQEFEISGCLLGLRQRGLAVVHEREGGRVQRYSEKFGDELGISREEQAVLAELLLRGPQTSTELARRAARMARIDGASHVEAILSGLRERQRARLLPRESGQRYARWTQLISIAAPPSESDERVETPASAPAHAVPTHAVPPHAGTAPSDLAPVAEAHPTAAAPPAADETSLRDEIAALRGEMAALRQRVDELESLIAD